MLSKQIINEFVGHEDVLSLPDFTSVRSRIHTTDLDITITFPPRFGSELQV